MDDVTLYMTDAEIVKSYKEAANKRKQVEILCQLNLCKPDDIINVLKKSDIDWRTLPRAYTESSKPKNNIMKSNYLSLSRNLSGLYETSRRGQRTCPKYLVL